MSERRPLRVPRCAKHYVHCETVGGCVHGGVQLAEKLSIEVAV